MDAAKKKTKSKQKESTRQQLPPQSAQQPSSTISAEPELFQKAKRIKPTPKIRPPPNSGPNRSTDEALAAQLRFMTPTERAAFRGQPRGKREHRAGLFWNRPGPSPLGLDPPPSSFPSTRSPSPPPSVGNQSVINFALKTGLLLPHQFTYLRPKPDHRQPDPDSEALMGPPEPRIKFDTPYETVKKALTSLKSELGLTTYPNRTYSLWRISPKACSSVEEVVMELDEYVSSIAKTSSSDEMKTLLMLFQRRLGLPAWPPFYNMLWFSPPDLLDHLSDNFVLR